MLDRGLPSLRQLAECHSYNLDNDPVYAHWSSAGFAIFVGCALAAARGAVTAAMHPAHERLAVFSVMTRAVAPLYVIPFVFGAQTLPRHDVWARTSLPTSLCVRAQACSGTATEQCGRASRARCMSTAVATCRRAPPTLADASADGARVFSGRSQSASIGAPFTFTHYGGLRLYLGCTLVRCGS